MDHSLLTDRPSDEHARPSGYRVDGSPFRPPLPLLTGIEAGSSGFGRGGRYGSVTSLTAEISSSHRLAPQTDSLPRARSKSKGKGTMHGSTASAGKGKPATLTPSPIRAAQDDAPPAAAPDAVPLTLLDALLRFSTLDLVAVESFIMTMGGEPTTMPIEHFELMSARSISPLVRGFVIPEAESATPRPASLIQKTLLWNAFTQLAHQRGGAISFSFACTGMNDEPLTDQMPAASSPPSVDPGAQLAALAVSISDAIRPETRGEKRRREPETAKYAGVMYQAEDAGDEVFELLTKKQHRDLLDLYDEVRWRHSRGGGDHSASALRNSRQIAGGRKPGP